MAPLATAGGASPSRNPMNMQKILVALVVAAGAATLIGCNDNGPAHAENVTKQIQSMPAEDRFQMIKENTGMSPQMKEAAIDNLPVSDEQKAKWKQELASAAAAGVPLRGGAAPTEQGATQ